MRYFYCVETNKLFLFFLFLFKTGLQCTMLVLKYCLCRIEMFLIINGNYLQRHRNPKSTPDSDGCLLSVLCWVVLWQCALCARSVRAQSCDSVHHVRVFYVRGGDSLWQKSDTVQNFSGGEISLDLTHPRHKNIINFKVIGQILQKIYSWYISAAELGVPVQECTVRSFWS
jgi:hypothetical protein